MIGRLFSYAGRTLVFTTASAVIAFSLYLIGTSLASVAMAVTTVEEPLPSELFEMRKEPVARPIAFLPLDEPQVSIQMVPALYASLPAPTDLAFDGEGNGFLLDASGAVVRVPVGRQRDSVPYVTLSDERTERGLDFISLALHPGFLDPKSPGFGYFYCVAPEIPGKREADFRPQHGETGEHHHEVIYEYRATDPRARLFGGTRREMMRFSVPGGQSSVQSLAFDAAGRLYVAVGDASTGAPGARSGTKNAMELSNPYGKILRIDPLERDAANGRYGVPRRNPFRFLDDAMPELWSYGLRSPRGMSVDGIKGELCILDQGHDGVEEINLSSVGGEHFGWDLCEGSCFYPPAKGERADHGVTAPSLEYFRGDPMAGAMMYRGKLFTELSNRIVFATVSGKLWMAEPGAAEPREIAMASEGRAWPGSFFSIRTLRPGLTGEIYVLCEDGSVYVLDKTSRTSSRPSPKRPLMAMAW